MGLSGSNPGRRSTPGERRWARLADRELWRHRLARGRAFRNIGVGRSARDRRRLGSRGRRASGAAVSRRGRSSLPRRGPRWLWRNTLSGRRRLDGRESAGPNHTGNRRSFAPRLLEWWPRGRRRRLGGRNRGLNHRSRRDDRRRGFVLDLRCLGLDRTLWDLFNYWEPAVIWGIGSNPVIHRVVLLFSFGFRAFLHGLLAGVLELLGR